ncbi:hypothetical protein [Pasteuria penetrans]|uniref:hypothetical protein n=1 Tax=Pasteuria penetrans TaxID=86005 RepID=UPI00165BABEC|nr:hypothetical protein [Pasteuria penetrans]
MSGEENQSGLSQGMGNEDLSSQKSGKGSGEFVEGVFTKVVSPGSGYENPIQPSQPAPTSEGRGGKDRANEGIAHSRKERSLSGEENQIGLSQGMGNEDLSFQESEKGSGEFVEGVFTKVVSPGSGYENPTSNRNRVKRGALPLVVGSVLTTSDAVDIGGQITGAMNNTGDINKRFSNINREIRMRKSRVETQKKKLKDMRSKEGVSSPSVRHERGILQQYEKDLYSSIKFKIEYPDSSLITEIKGSESSAFWSVLTGRKTELVNENKKSMREGNARYDKAYEHLLRWGFRSKEMEHWAKGREHRAEELVSRIVEEEKRAEEGEDPLDPRCTEGRLDCAQKKLERARELSKHASTFVANVKDMMRNISDPLVGWHLEKEGLEGIERRLVTVARPLWYRIMQHRENDGGRGTEDFDSFEKKVERNEERTWERGEGASSGYERGKSGRLVPQPLPWMKRKAPLSQEDQLLQDRYLSNEHRLNERRLELIRIYHNSSWVDIPKDLRADLDSMMGKMYEMYGDVKNLGGQMSEDEKRRVDNLITEGEELREKLIAAEPRLELSNVHERKKNDYRGVRMRHSPPGAEALSEQIFGPIYSTGKKKSIAAESKFVHNDNNSLFSWLSWLLPPPHPPEVSVRM